MPNKKVVHLCNKCDMTFEDENVCISHEHYCPVDVAELVKFFEQRFVVGHLGFYTLQDFDKRYLCDNEFGFPAIYSAEDLGCQQYTDYVDLLGKIIIVEVKAETDERKLIHTLTINVSIELMSLTESPKVINYHRRFCGDMNYLRRFAVPLIEGGELIEEGDYKIRFQLINEKEVVLQNLCAIARKMNQWFPV